MHRSLIIAKIVPGTESKIAQIFAESDTTTPLPEVVGVRLRELYTLNDLYLHVVETESPGSEAIRHATRHPEFRRISGQLAQYVSPYLPSWRSPEDARAKLFYRWTPDGAQMLDPVRSI